MEKKKYVKPEISRQQLEELLFQANENLLVANEKLKKEEEARMELFANLSHDLRSPMAALVSSVEFLKSGKAETEEESAAILDLMERRLHTLQNLINDLFLLTKVESPSLELRTEILDAELFLEEFFYEREADSRYDERCLNLEIESNLNAVISVDPEKMIRVLDNLFSNALKYSDCGAEITLAAGKDGENLWIEVRDSGIGIPAEDLPKIFERSYRVTKSRTPGDDGSGLGLAIARGIVEKHGGKISCTSVFGKGSVFRILLPLSYSMT